MNDDNTAVEEIDHESSIDECRASQGNWHDGWVNEGWVSVDQESGIVSISPSKACVLSALRAVVASGETPGEPNGGYGTVAHGKVISAPGDFSDLVGTTNAIIDEDDLASLDGHPNILVQNGKRFSTAFGRYQMRKCVSCLFPLRFRFISACGS